jgi:TatD DNase family protein
MVAPPVAPRAAPVARFVDTHAHLNDRRFADDVAPTIERARGAGVAAVVVVGYDLHSSARAVHLAEQFDGLWAAVGIHPHHARDVDVTSLVALERLAAAGKVVAVGECGLDFYRDLSPRPAQRAAFEAHLDLADRLNLPVVVHCRDAMEETLGLLGRRKPRGGGVMHCFDGTAADAARVIELGFHVSVAGPITYRRDRTLAEAIASVPADRLVIETDCPWLSPQGHRGERNEPALVRIVAESVAAVRGEPLAVVARQTAQNASALFRNPELAGTGLAREMEPVA